MPRSHKPRKRYVPKRVALDAVDFALDRVLLLTPAQQATLIAPTLNAFEALRTGRWADAHWRNLADALNVAEALAERAIAANHDDTFRTAQHVLATVLERATTRRTRTLYPAEITALDDAIFVHRIQLQHCSQGELEAAVNTVKRRVAAALAGAAGARAIFTPGLLGTEVTA